MCGRHADGERAVWARADPVAHSCPRAFGHSPTRPLTHSPIAMIGILFTGGTIAMKLNPATGAAVPALSSAEIIALVPQLGHVAALEFEDFSRLPGPHVTPDHMWRLARRAASWLERPDVDGLVITHGTDTIEETAFLLDLVLTTDKPVVLVGAMRTVSDPSWDGPANLIAAVRVAASPA